MPTERDPYVRPWGVGMPAWLRLHEFGQFVYQAFGHYPILVGSALRTKRPRDVDVRLILPQSEYLTLIGPASECGQPGTRWAALSIAFSITARQMVQSRRPIDFQIQTRGHANVYRGEPRIVLDGLEKGENG